MLANFWETTAVDLEPPASDDASAIEAGAAELPAVNGLSSIVVESGALALAGLAGMYADLVKKTAYHDHPFDFLKARQMVGEIGRLQKLALAWLDRTTES